MSLHVTDLVGYRFDPTKKSWLGAFLIGEYDAAAGAGEPTIQSKHYELLNLDQIIEREKQSIALGDRDAALEYTTAEHAIQDVIDGKRGTPNDLPPGFDDNLFSEHQGELYKMIDPAKYVDWTEYLTALKTATVKAELVPEGEKVDTIMADGLVETTNTAGPDGGYKVTAQTGEEYLLQRAEFEKRYDKTDVEGVYAPKPDPRKVMGVDQNVGFKASWGEDMRIRGGGIFVHNSKDDIYGIQPNEVKASYTFL